MGKLDAIIESFIFSIVILIIIPSVLVGIAASGTLRIPIIIASIIAALLIGFNVDIINNYSDWNGDIVNGKRKKMHKETSKTELMLVYVFTLLIAIVILYLINSFYLWIVTILAVVLGILYSSITKFKDIFPMNHIAMGIGYGVLPFAFGFFSTSNSASKFISYYPLILFLFVVCFGYSMTKDYGDIAGDSLYKKNTMPIIFGKSTALKIQKASIIFAYLLLLAFVLSNLISSWFLLSLISLAVAFLIMAHIGSNNDPAVLKKANMYNRINHLILRMIIIIVILLV